MSQTIRTLLCHRDVATGIVCLQSLYRYSHDPFELLIHDDGTLTPEDTSILTSALPGASVLKRDRADVLMEARLQYHPSCRQLRRDYRLALKLLDVLLLAEEDLAYCDSDVLFFRPFKGLFQWPDNTTGAIFMQDRQFAYAARPWHLAPIGPLRLPINVNTGLIFFRKKAYDLDYLEWLWSNPSLRSIFHNVSCWAEQTCWAALGFRAGCQLWSDSHLAVVNECWQPGAQTIGAHFVTSYRHRLAEFQGNSFSNDSIHRPEFVPASECTVLSAGFSQMKRRARRLLEIR